MSDLNEQLRAALESLLKRYGDLAGSGDAGNWDWEAEDVVTAARSALAATPAPQAAPSDVQVAEICCAVRPDDHKHEGQNGDVDYLTYDGAVVRAYLAAAPAVAITQAATSEPQKETAAEAAAGDTFPRRCESPDCTPVAATNIDVEQLQARLDALLDYPEGSVGAALEEKCFLSWRETHVNRPGWEDTDLFIYRKGLVDGKRAHLAGTTPNTEAPSVKTWQENFRETYPNYPLDKVSAGDKVGWLESEVTNLRAALSAQQAGVQEAPSEDAKDEARERVRNAVWKALPGTYYCDRVWSAWQVGTMTQDDFTPAEDCDDVLDEITDSVIAALAAATQTEKP